MVIKCVFGNKEKVPGICGQNLEWSLNMKIKWNKICFGYGFVACIFLAFTIVVLGDPIFINWLTKQPLSLPDPL